ncbi:unnamed protein product [Caenorhabditis angaria]|uniref:Uncharacterized protein n=1 Tax=Caenorhabditis angaria TaxID=860376 RepID=A0A9P1N1X4_9PELO|nr:unnamed protein product [Caenorhabditis angaria]
MCVIVRRRVMHIFVCYRTFVADSQNFFTFHFINPIYFNACVNTLNLYSLHSRGKFIETCLKTGVATKNYSARRATSKSKLNRLPNSSIFSPRKIKMGQKPGLSSKSATKIGMVHAPKILKKKKAQAGSSVTNNNKILNETNVKRVTFEVEKFISREAAKDDREKARDRMLASLGAAPQKREYVNYKDLKIDRANQKADAKAQAEMHHANNLSMTVIKKKKNNNKKK